MTAALCCRCERLFRTRESVAQLAGEQPTALCPFSDLERNCSLCRLIAKMLTASAVAMDQTADLQRGEVRLLLMFRELDAEDGDDSGSETGDVFVADDTTAPSSMLCYLYDGTVETSVSATLAWYSIPEAAMRALGLDSTSCELVRHWRRFGGFYTSMEYWKQDCFANPVMDMVRGCRRHHRQCRLRDISVLPTMVLDVSSLDLDGRIHLYVPGHQHVGEYIALSYCWGGPQKILTTKMNRAAHIEQGIELARLPLTIAQAAQMTARLGIQYLWVDALCIVQDDDTTKAAEIERMGDIYSNATAVLLAGAQSRTANDGFPNHFDDVAVVSFPAGPAGETVPVCLASEFQEASFLDTRGWTFQERHLASRTLEIGGSQGASLSCVEAFVRFTGDAWEPDGLALAEKNSARASRAGLWHAILEQYSVRQLTFAADRLPALAGYARMYAQGSDVYLAGLWKSQIIDDLMWRSGCAALGRKLDLGKHQSPSWSWISVLDHEMDSPRQGANFVTNNLRHRLSLAGSDDGDAATASLISHSIRLVDADAPFGRVLGGSVTLRARMVPIGSVADRAAVVRECDYRLSPDEEARLCLLWLKSASRWNLVGTDRVQRGDGGLVVLPCDASESFRRVGRFWDWTGNVDGKSSMVDWEDVEFRDITLI